MSARERERERRRCIATEEDGDRSDTSDCPESESRIVDVEGDGNVQFLADLFCREKQLVADLRKFVAGVAARFDGATRRPDVCGLWWESHLTGVSEAVRDMAKYFHAAGER